MYERILPTIQAIRNIQTLLRKTPMSHYIYRLFINFLLIHYFIYRLIRCRVGAPLTVVHPSQNSGRAAFPYPALCETNRSHYHSYILTYIRGLTGGQLLSSIFRNSTQLQLFFWLLRFRQQNRLLMMLYRNAVILSVLSVIPQ